MTLVREIRKVENGYIVEARFPFGKEFPFGEVVCPKWEDVLKLLENCKKGT